LSKLLLRSCENAEDEWDRNPPWGLNLGAGFCFLLYDASSLPFS
jgi:hypothetical protein